jgi:hypothetical protein
MRARRTRGWPGPQALSVGYHTKMRSLTSLGLVAITLVGLGCSRNFSPPEQRGTALAVDPPNAQVAPRGSTTFTIRGGRPPYALVEGASQAGQTTLTGTTARYVAGETGSLGDLFVVGDQAGHTVTVRVQIGGALTLTPPSAAVPLKETQLFVAQGGQAPYRFTLDEGLRDGGARIDHGLFTAGGRAGAGALTVLDANDAGATAQVVVTAGVAVIPQNARIAPSGQLQFVAVGGRAPYQWSLVESPPPGIIDPATGLLSVAADARPGQIQVVATDSAGESGTAAVEILPALQAPPTPPPSVIVPGFEFDLVAIGGSPPYQFSYKPRGNVSGGSLSPSGHYRAGPNGSQTDDLQVQDTTGTTRDVKLEVGTPTLSSAALITAFAPSAGLAPHTPWMRNGELLARSTQALPAGYGAGLVRYTSSGQLLPNPVPHGEELAATDLDGDGHVDLVLQDPLSPDRALVYAGSAQGNFTLVGGGGAVPEVLAVLPEFVFGGNVSSSRPVIGAVRDSSGNLDLQAGSVEDLISGRGLVSLGIDAGQVFSVEGALALGATFTSVHGAVVTQLYPLDGGPFVNVIDISYDSPALGAPVVMNPPTLVATLAGYKIGTRALLAAPLRGDPNQNDLVMLTRAGNDPLDPFLLNAVVSSDPTAAPVVVTTVLPGFDPSAGYAPDQVLVGPSRAGLGSVVVATRQGDLSEYDLMAGKDGGWLWSAPQALASDLRAAQRTAVAGTGDLDGDGNLDLALVDSAGGLTVYFGDASGRFEGISPPGTNRAGTRFRGGAYKVPFQLQAVPLQIGGLGLLVDDDGALSLFAGSTDRTGTRPSLGLLDQTPPVGLTQLIGTFTDSASGRTFIIGSDGASRLLAAELVSTQLRGPELVTELFAGSADLAPIQLALIDPVRGGPGSTLAVLRALSGDGGSIDAELDLLDLTVGAHSLTAGPPRTVLTWSGGAPITSFAVVDLDGVPPADLVFSFQGLTFGTSIDPWGYYALAIPDGDGGGVLGTPAGMLVPATRPNEARALVDPLGKTVVMLDATINTTTTLYRATRYPTGPAFGPNTGITVELARASDGGAGCLVDPLTLIDNLDGGLDLAGTLLHPRGAACTSGGRVGNNLPAYIDVVSGSVALWRLDGAAGTVVVPRETTISGLHSAPNWVLLDANADGSLDVAAQLLGPHTTGVSLGSASLRPSSAALDLNLWAGLDGGGFAP